MLGWTRPQPAEAAARLRGTFRCRSSLLTRTSSTALPAAPSPSSTSRPPRRGWSRLSPGSSRSPRRAAGDCWSSRTIPPSSSALPNCWRTTTSISRRWARAGRRSSGSRRSPPTAWCSTCACRTCPVSRCWRQLRDDGGLADTPVVVFTGRELTARGGRAAAHHGAQRGGQGRRSRPNGCWTRRRCSCTGWSPTCRLRSSRCSSGCTPRTRTWSDRTVLLVDDDARNIFALSSVLERRGMQVLTATTGSEAVSIVELRAGGRDRADGHHDAGDGRLRDDRRRSARTRRSGGCRSSR